LPKLSASTAVASSGDASIDAFVDALWLEDGLAPNSLQAYRRDLLKLQTHLQGAPLSACSHWQLQQYFAAQHAGSKATTANRRLTVFKRYFRWALRHGLVQQDPTLQLQSAKQARAQDLE
jgi:integrase/recombinase XerD